MPARVLLSQSRSISSASSCVGRLDFRFFMRAPSGYRNPFDVGGRCVVHLSRLTYYSLLISSFIGANSYPGTSAGWPRQDMAIGMLTGRVWAEGDTRCDVCESAESRDVWECV